MVLLSACVVGDETPLPDPPGPADADGVVTSPRHGDIVSGDTQTATLEFTGYHARGDYRIDVQVLDDPNVATSWTTIGTTLTASDASAEHLHAWSVIVAPGRIPQRWPAGGVVRMRAVGGDGDVLSVLFHDVDACGAETDSVHALVAKCTAPVTNGLVLVSPSRTPADVANRVPFLDRRSAVDAAETQQYYAAINAPATIADFRTRYGFDAANSATTYYNAGDLGIGREMHCQPQAGDGLACYVSNYGAFGGDRNVAIDAAVSATDWFATVAMVYTPPASAPNSVQFMVYTNTGLALQAKLDTFGDNVSVPNNCINCHGGGQYDPATHAVTGARFLPFDTTGFEFSTKPRYRGADQAESIRALNKLVAKTEPTTATRELLTGFDADPAFVPDGWKGSSIEREVYTNAVAVACRGCHSSLESSLDFRTAEGFKNYRTSIAADLCDSHTMPSAEIPLRRLWTTSARAYLVDYLNITGSCAP